MSVAINFTGTPGLFPTANIINPLTKQIILPSVPIPEISPGVYQTRVRDIPTEIIPSPIPSLGSIGIPVSRPIPVEVAISGIGVISGVESIAVGSNVLTPYEINAEIVPQNVSVVDAYKRCPYCFSRIDESVDPENFVWSDDPTLCIGSKVMPQYQGYMQIKANHIKELQDNRKNLEDSLEITPLTEFSPIDVTNFYQNLSTYILELRSSTEKILTETGTTKETYFNYNEFDTDMKSGNHQLDWIDPVDLTSSSNLCNFQCNNLHIEDLRKYIPTSLLEYTACIDVLSSYGEDNDFSGIGKISSITNHIIDNYNRDETNLNRMGDSSTTSTFNDFNYIYTIFNYSSSSSSLFIKFRRLNLDTKIWSSQYSLLFQDSALTTANMSTLCGAINIRKDNSESDFLLLLSEYAYAHTTIGSSTVNLLTFATPNLLPCYLAQYSSPRVRILGTSDGTSNQNFNISSCEDIVWDNIKGSINSTEIVVSVEGISWTYVSNLSNSSSSDEVFYLDTTNGIISFGDNVHGKIPQNEKVIYLRISLLLANYNKWVYEKNLIEPDQIHQVSSVLTKGTSEICIVQKTYPTQILEITNWSTSYINTNTSFTKMYAQQTRFFEHEGEYITQASQGIYDMINASVSTDIDFINIYGNGSNTSPIHAFSLSSEENKVHLDEWYALWADWDPAPPTYSYSGDYTHYSSSTVYNGYKNFTLPLKSYVPYSTYEAGWHEEGIGINSTEGSFNHFLSFGDNEWSKHYFMWMSEFYTFVQAQDEYWTTPYPGDWMWMESHYWDINLGGSATKIVNNSYFPGLVQKKELISISGCPSFTPYEMSSGVGAYIDAGDGWAFQSLYNYLYVYLFYRDTESNHGFPISCDVTFPTFTFLITLYSDESADLVNKIYGVTPSTKSFYYTITGS